MVVLGLLWLVLLIVEFVRGIGPMLQLLSDAIWVVFLIDFLLRLSLAPRKLSYLRRNWLTSVALLIPALRIFRIARAFRSLQALRAVRGVRLVRVVSSLNRGMRALGRSMQRRGFGYVVALTALVAFGGAAGIYAFERFPGRGPESYFEALWWTAMLLTTIGPDTWPTTPEGRILTLLLSVYALGVLGYVTAGLASFFIGRDAEDAQAAVAGKETLEALRTEIVRLREEVEQLREIE